jgi:hypothetical protein
MTAMSAFAQGNGAAGITDATQMGIMVIII